MPLPAPVKRLARGLLSISDRLPGAYGRRRLAEQWIYRKQAHVHDLPPIFHYWSNTHLRPLLEQMGFTHPAEFFLKQTLRQGDQTPDRPLAIASLGSGNCDLEVGLAAGLRDAGRRFSFDCIDINPAMLQRGRQQADQAGLTAFMRFVRGDFNRWRPESGYDVVIANQCLHHVVELEDLFENISSAIGAGGVFLTSDMIGRNGHQRWPEALELLLPLWEELPDRYHFDHTTGVARHRFLDRDCSLGSFEGIRAQDVLPLLCRRFEFDLFVPFANIILVFVERAFGPNFDPESAQDREFIDRVHRIDADAIASGRITPTQMLAALRNTATTPRLVDPALTPEACIRQP